MLSWPWGVPGMTMNTSAERVLGPAPAKLIVPGWNLMGPESGIGSSLIVEVRASVRRA